MGTGSPVPLFFPLPGVWALEGSRSHVSVETQRAHLEGLSLCVVVIMSPLPPLRCLGRGSHQDCVCPLLDSSFAASVPGVWGICSPGWSTPVLGRSGRGWELQPEARKMRTDPEQIYFPPSGAAGWVVCRQDATHWPNTQTSANISGRRERAA